MFRNFKVCRVAGRLLGPAVDEMQWDVCIRSTEVGVKRRNLS